MNQYNEKVLLSPKSLTQKSIKPEEATLKNIIEILNLTISQRSSRQGYILQELTKGISFFSNLIKENGEYVHRISCEKLKYQFVPAGEFVFEIHTFGKVFYIIIEGSVSVLIPVTQDGDTVMKKIANMTSGMSFGELAIIKDQPRAASIQCDTDCHFAILSKDDYMNIIGKIQARKLDDFIEFLLEIPMFKHWTKKRLELLTYHFSSLQFKRKQLVFNINDPPKFVYIVKSGEFEIMKKMNVKNNLGIEEGFFVKIALLGRGEVFGDDETIMNKNHSAVCSCYSTTGELLCMTSSDFLLKVQKEDFIRDFNLKNRSKTTIREKRLHNFKEFLIQTSQDEQKIEEKRSETPGFMPYVGHLKKTSPNYKRVRPLSLKNIQKLKRKALGRKSDSHNYSKFSTTIDFPSTISTFSNNSVIKTSPENIQKIKPMKCHQPGGYYRAKLKKSWAGL